MSISVSSAPLNHFASFGLHPALCKAAEKAGFTRPTAVQKAGIPPLLEGRDVLLPSQTGSGKTAAFVLPALHKLALLKQAEENNDGYTIPRILILEPTRDLAMQTAEVCRQLGRQLPFRTRVICGGISREQQCKSLEYGTDIIVATHGRLLDLAHQGDVILSEIIMLVLDEADRLLDEEFSASMTALIPYLADRPQTIFCSATLPEPVMALARQVTHDPVRVHVEEESITPKRIRQRALFLEEHEKEALIIQFLGQHSPTRRSILFVKTKNSADKLAKILRHLHFKATSLHGGHTQGERKNTLNLFQEGKTDILVTTDIAARGLDIDKVTLVLNIDMPNSPETYVHRIGRTARAGRSGHALSLITPPERPLLRDIERHIQHRIRIVTPGTMHK